MRRCVWMGVLALLVVSCGGDPRVKATLLSVTVPMWQEDGVQVCIGDDWCTLRHPLRSRVEWPYRAVMMQIFWLPGPGRTARVQILTRGGRVLCTLADGILFDEATVERRQTLAVCPDGQTTLGFHVEYEHEN